VLAIQHVQVNPPGLVGEVLEELTIPYDVIQATEDHFPDLTAYSAIVSFGGTQHVYLEKQEPYIAHEEELIRQALKQDMPFLGICLGSQLLAHALGAKVVKRPPEKMGFLQIHFSQEGQRDPIFADLPGYEQAFHWHDDVFDIPKDAVKLAGDKPNEHQAFRYGRNAYGTQYHVELTAGMLNNWLTDPELKKEFIDIRGIDAYNKIMQERPTLYPIYREHSRILFINFLRIGGLIA
jgi:GMP synthase-like glutamine amidotransferase